MGLVNNVEIKRFAMNREILQIQIIITHSGFVLPYHNELFLKQIHCVYNVYCLGSITQISESNN